MRYRVDLSGYRRVQTTVEVEATDTRDATDKAEEEGRARAPFVWEMDEGDEVHSICTDHIEELGEEQA